MLILNNKNIVINIYDVDDYVDETYFATIKTYEKNHVICGTDEHGFYCQKKGWGIIFSRCESGMEKL